MSSSSADPSAEERELSLVSKVEMRIALADSEAKLEGLLKTYLAPLLLKLASDSVKVRNKVISVCQHVNTRVRPHDIKLPVATLLKQYKDNPESQLIRHFDLLYIQQGLPRVKIQERLEFLPALIQGISASVSSQKQQSSTIFFLFLQLLPHFVLPLKGSTEDLELKSRLEVSDNDTEVLAFWLGRLLLLSILSRPRNGPDQSLLPKCPGLTSEEYQFVTNYGKTGAWDASVEGGMNLTETKISAIKFLNSGIFSDYERFLPCFFASADANSRISSAAEDNLKRVLPNVDVEDKVLVEDLYLIYFGKESNDGPPPVLPPLQTKILGILSKSLRSTEYPDYVVRVVEEGLALTMTGFGAATKITLQIVKKRTAIFTFINFVARRAKQNDLHAIGPRLTDRLQTFLLDQGWPAAQRDEDLSLRGYAYEVIGLLAKVTLDRTRFEDKISLFRWLVKSLREDNSGKDVTFSIEDALSNMMNTFSKDLKDDRNTSTFCGVLLECLLQFPRLSDGITRGLRSTRFIGVKYANHSLPYSDHRPRWINILAINEADSDSQELLEEGKKGLDPFWHQQQNYISSLGREDSENRRSIKFPSFVKLMRYFTVFTPDAELRDIVRGEKHSREIIQTFRSRYRKAFNPAFVHCRQVLLMEVAESVNIEVDIGLDWNRKLDSLFTSNRRLRLGLRAHCLKLSQSDDGLLLVADLLRAAFEGLSHGNETSASENIGQYFVELCSIFSEEIWSKAGLFSDVVDLEDSIFSSDLNIRGGAAQGFGMLASHGSCDQVQVSKMVLGFLHRVESWRDAVGEDLVKSCGSILALAYYFSRKAWRLSKTEIGEEMFSTYLKLIFEILSSSSDVTFKEAVFMSISQLCLYFVLKPLQIPNGLSFRELVSLVSKTAKSGNVKAIQTLGHLGMIVEEDQESENSEDSDITFVEKELYACHEIKEAETQFVVGEALSYLASGWQSEALFTKIDVLKTENSDELSDNLPKTPSGPARTQGKTLLRVLKNTIKGCSASKPSLLKASVLQLLTLLEYNGNRPETRTLLPSCQMAMKSCLSHRDDIVQEAASRALGLIYERGTSEQKDDLVRGLVNMFSDNKSNLAGHVTEDTQLFEQGALPTGEGSVSTYKDILNLASEVGDSSLVYRFMSLASNNSIWSSRAAFGKFGLSNVFSDSSVNGYLAQNPKIYPKLYRYKFDPNPNVRRSMKDIWDALVKDSSATISEHFDAIISDLLQNILAKEWRVREASCAAIGDLVQGRELHMYEEYLGQIWTLCFKVLDDIKETVRNAAASLARVLTGILVRSLEAGDSASTKAETQLKHVLPFLLSTSGLESSAAEVQGFALDTLLQIIKKSGGKTLRPFIPELVERMIGLLSTLEPQAVNYLHLNASKYNLTEQKIDDMRLASVRGSPLIEAIERCLDLMDETTMKEVAASVQNSIRTSVGLPSKVGCSRVLVTLSTRHNFLFRPYADESLKVLRAHIRDRNETVSSSYAGAIGYVSRLASEKSLLNIIQFCRRLYFESDGDKPRLTAGDIILAISKHATDRFSSIHAEVLPFVFVAKHDSDVNVKELFSKTWEDSVGGSRTVILYLDEIAQLAHTYLDSRNWVLKHGAARAIAGAATTIAGSSNEVVRQHAPLVWQVLEPALKGQSWDGKEDVLKAFVVFVEKSRDFWREKKDIAAEIDKVMIREAKRQNKAYRQFAVRALGQVAAARDDTDMSLTVLEIAENVISELTDNIDEDNKMDVDGEDKTKNAKSKELTLAGTVKTVLDAIHPSLLKESTSERVSKALSLLVRANKPNLGPVRLATFESIKNFFTGLSALKAGQGPLNERDIRPNTELLLFDIVADGYSEAARIERAQSILAVVEAEKKLIAVEKIDEMLERERSLAVKQDLEKAKKNLSTP